MSAALSPRLLAALALAIAAILAIPATSARAGLPIFESAFGPEGTSAPTDHFEAPGAIGVDETSHEVYVADYGTGTVEKFDEDGTPTDFTALGENKISGFSFPYLGEGDFLEGLNQIAVNQASHDFYVLESHNGLTGKVKAFHADGSPAKFTGIAGEPTELSGFAEACGLAVDAFGDIYVADFPAPGEVEIFEPDGSPLTSFSVSEPCNLAVDSAGTVYVNYFPELVLGIDAFTPSEFPVTASTTYSASTANPIDPNETLTLATDPVSDRLFAAEKNEVGEEEYVTEIASYDETGSRLGQFGLFDHSEGIAVDGSTGKVYATDLEGERQVQIFGPAELVPPSVEETSFTNATATEADLRAQVNPHGSQVHYRFQYVTQAAFEASGFEGAPQSGEGTLPGASTEQTATAHIGGLTPDTVYRFRVLAENEGGADLTPEPAPALTTFATPPAGLPDGRAYEMVSPPQKLGEVLPPEPVAHGSCPFECLPGSSQQLMPMQSDPQGNAIAYTGQPFSAGLAAAPNEYLSSRTAAGWATQGISPLLSNKGLKQGYKAFSADLARGVIYQEGPSGLSQDAPSDAEGQSFANLYLREADGALTPLVAQAPLNRSAVGPNSFVIFYGDANAGGGGAAALSHVVFAADDALTGEVPGVAPAAPAVGASVCRFPEQHCNLYEWVDGGGLRLVSAVSESAAAAAPVLGGGLLVAKNETLEGPAVQGAVSDDGRRIFWTDEESGALYVRVDGAQTLEVPSPGTCKESLAAKERTCFLAASADGGEVLLSDGQLEVLNEAGSAYEAGEDLSGGLGGFAGTLGAAEDFSRIYFVLDPAKGTEALTKGTGDLTEGSATITSLVAARGKVALQSGSTTATLAATSVGKFVAGQPLNTVTGIAAGTTIVAVEGATLTLSAPATATVASATLTSVGPEPFAPGQTIEGPGIPPGTTILAAGAGTLEISAAATATKEDAALVAGVPLAAGEENSEGAKPKLSGFNLYAWEEGTTSFIGALVGADNNTAGVLAGGDWRPWESGRTAQVSPGGRYLAFMSAAPLSGYDNEVRPGGNCGGVAKCFEVFEYEATAGKLICASCNPSGERPLGDAKLSLISASNAGFAPLPLPGNLAREGRGRLFFESMDVLSPHDSNGGIQDVYEWEPQGVGSCERAGGCVYLISSGHAVNDSLFVNSTPSGNDAFFIAREQLSLADKDDLLDLYDARVGGGLPAETEALRSECQGEACQPSPALPNDPTPSSSSFAGAGNVKPKQAKRHHKAKRKHKHRRHAKKRHHKANAGRGGAR